METVNIKEKLKELLYALDALDTEDGAVTKGDVKIDYDNRNGTYYITIGGRTLKLYWFNRGNYETKTNTFKTKNWWGKTKTIVENSTSIKDYAYYICFGELFAKFTEEEWGIIAVRLAEIHKNKLAKKQKEQESLLVELLPKLLAI